METTLLRDDLLDGQIAITKACVDAANNILQHQSLLLQTVLEMPRISVEGSGRVSRTILSTSLTCSLSAATIIVQSWGRLSESRISSYASAPAPALNARGGPRKPKAIAAA